ncbi:hypothetical protein GSI_05894 [Ganoderma sinense ZZ0214-1]|uniref:Importin-9 central HEAT repeats domain-containing protein n=1 Tax=Ganoderma sinense ZZ0214-1 TaxID=1077348 RepID=A0A2G8SBQ3_9APHY|nr:hypothetical protein GSI_05894 [Ganoderma sinense ZZ0214-1]
MQVFAEFIKADLSEDQILPVLRQLLPVLLNILGAPEQHSALTRSRTLSVFCQCVEALYMVKDQFPDAVKEATNSVLPVWLDALKTLLNVNPLQDVENSSNWDGLAIRIQVFKTLNIIHTSFPRALTPHLHDLLNASIHHLSVFYPTFNHYYLQGGAAVPHSSEDETIELIHLVCPMLDFVGRLARSGRARDWFEGENFANLVNLVFSWAQMTQSDEEEWADNANAFVAQESDDSFSYSVRVAGFDLLGVLLERSTIATIKAFQVTIERVIAQSQQQRESGSQDWWRPLEAALAAVGSQGEDMLDAIDDEIDSGRGKPIDIESLLTNVIPSYLVLSQFPFLQGRAFVFASQYAKLLPGQLAVQYLEAAIQVLEASEAGVPVKVSAVKAIHNFCQNMDDAVAVPLAPRIAKDIGPFLPVTSDDTLTLVLETLAAVVEIDDGKWITEDLARAIVVACLDVWMKNNRDPIFISILANVFESLARSPAYQAVVQQALPALTNALTAATDVDSYVASAAFELVAALIQGAPQTGLGDGVFAMLAPALYASLRSTEDRDTIQNGIIALTHIVRKDVNQLIAWSDPATGQSGLDGVLQVIAKQLQGEDESGSLFIGDLIIHLLRRAGEAILPVLPQLLEAMVRRMGSAKTATFLQSLVIPFAFLIHNQRDTVLDLLEGVQADGAPALDVLVRTWCENAETFQGFWPPRISTLALCSLFASERPSLQTLVVKGDIIVKPETKNVPTEFTSVPFPVKALKLLLHDLQSGGEAASMGFSAKDVSEVASDDGDEEWAEEEALHQGFKADEFAFLSDMLGPRGMAFDNDDALEGADDEDLKNDPVSTMDMQACVLPFHSAHLLGFFKECAARNTGRFSAAVQQLTPEEIQVMQKVVGQH